MTIRRSAAVLSAILFLLISYISVAQTTRNKRSNIKTNVPVRETRNLLRQHWIDSVYSRLSDTERIGQLFMVAAYSGGKDYNEEKIRTLVANRRVGGLIFMQGTPEEQGRQTNEFQRMSQVPLLIGMDAEWGLGMRLTGVKDLPRAAMIGATRDTNIMYHIGAAVADQCKRLGVHINFAPVVDVNNNPDNPIINARSFGEDKRWVARLGIAYMKGLQQNGVMACAKHFPGHGNTATDSHVDMPVLNQSLEELEEVELYPFRELMKAGIQSVMVAHLKIPALEQGDRTPTTLSRNTITGLLKGTMGYKGLVFTDALNMDGIAKYYKPGEVDLKAFQAGNDVLLFSQDVPTAIATFQAALADSSISMNDIEIRVKRILGAKYDAGLNSWKPVAITNATADLNKDFVAMRTQTAEAGVTLVRDRNNILNKLYDKDVQIGYIGINAPGSTPLYETLQRNLGEIKVGWIPKGATETMIERVQTTMKTNDITVVGIHNLAFYPGSSRNHGLDAKQISFMKSMQDRSDVIFVMMGNAYLLKNICSAPSVMVGYEDDSITQVVAAEIILQQKEPKGMLPVTPCAGMRMEPRNKAAITRRVQKAVPTSVTKMKKVDYPEDAGVTSPAALDKLNRFMAQALAGGAFPGARVLAAKDGKVFYDESFGYTSFERSQQVTENTIYDVASLTKVLSTTLAVMKLYETGQLDLNKTLVNYLQWTAATNKAGIKIKDLLLHQAGLKAWIPFYQETLIDGNLRTDLYKSTPGERYNIEVAKNLYLRNDYKDSIWSTILESSLENGGKYVYSDLDYYFLAAVVEKITGQTIDRYVEEQFYKPLGLTTITYNPLKKFKEQDMAPTENDMTFRKQTVRGYVHDPGAALFGGVAGHAGIFATANDVAVIFQMLLNGGTYNNKRLFTKETVSYFSAYNTKISRRGIGFDKPSADKDDGGPAGNRVTGYAFGHQGFTGTCAWADPGTGIVFVFLSNRVNPSANNGTINKMSVRTVAQDYIYEAFGYPNNRERPDVQQQQLSKK
ncbi:MAG: hypothetical protein EOP56_16290 [Sphingobacteriales bacterium]|nr:MAG: hypothetical protein EOP56_16290 [Sphingobacteriales bacterium]